MGINKQDSHQRKLLKNLNKLVVLSFVAVNSTKKGLFTFKKLITY